MGGGLGWCLELRKKKNFLGGGKGETMLSWGRGSEGMYIELYR